MISNNIDYSKNFCLYVNYKRLFLFNLFEHGFFFLIGQGNLAGQFAVLKIYRENKLPHLCCFCVRIVIMSL